MAQRMHDDEIGIDDQLVRRLLAAQLPRLAPLPIARVTPEGTVNAIFRLGQNMVVRLPRIPRHQDPDELPGWLTALAPQLPLAIPELLYIGEPDERYPWRWSVVRWLEGERFDLGRLADPCAAAVQLAEFIQALHGVDVNTLPCPPPPAPELAMADGAVRRAAEKARWMIDTDAFLEAWNDALRISTSDHEPVLVHRDLGPGNLIVRDGRLVAVIDWGALSIGDAALDVAYEGLFTGEARAAFRSVLPVDDGMWSRIRAGQLWNVVSVAYYAETNPPMAAEARRVIEEILAERKRRGQDG